MEIILKYMDDFLFSLSFVYFRLDSAIEIIYNKNEKHVRFFMFKDNICKFNKTSNAVDNVSILNFVYEKGSGTKDCFSVQSVFRIHVVVSGQGEFTTLNRSTQLTAGNVFITFPSTEYLIKNTDGLEYSYVSFIGLRSYDLLARVGITKCNFFYPNAQEILPFWLQSLKIATDDNIDLVAESVLFFTLGYLCPKKAEKAFPETNVLKLKKLAEDRFTDPQANLKTLCEELFYSPKYASAVFKKYTGTNFSDFLTGLRINNAIRLMENGVTSVKQIAALSGFDDALYFSKLFKKREGCTPKQRISDIKEYKNGIARHKTTPRNDDI